VTPAFIESEVEPNRNFLAERYALFRRAS